MLRLGAGDAVSSDDVFVSFQTSRLVEVPVPASHGSPESHCASSPASELIRYSVPPLSVAN